MGGRPAEPRNSDRGRVAAEALPVASRLREAEPPAVVRHRNAVPAAGPEQAVNLAVALAIPAGRHRTARIRRVAFRSRVPDREASRQAEPPVATPRRNGEPVAGADRRACRVAEPLVRLGPVAEPAIRSGPVAEPAIRLGPVAEPAIRTARPGHRVDPPAAASRRAAPTAVARPAWIGACPGRASGAGEGGDRTSW